ncbi:MAG: antitoxin VapB family protein [Promethearchaeota archaeon]
MPSRSISIKEEIYNQLDKYRLVNESFSEAIKRLLDSNADILDLAGAWKKISDVEPALDIVEKVVKKLHEEENNIKLI